MKTAHKDENVKKCNTEIAKALFDVAMDLTEHNAIALLEVAIMMRDK